MASRKTLFSNKGKGVGGKQSNAYPRGMKVVKNSFTKPSPKSRQLRPS